MPKDEKAIPDDQIAAELLPTSDGASSKANLEARWKAENRHAIEEMNRYIDEHGLPLGEYRSL